MKFGIKKNLLGFDFQKVITITRFAHSRKQLCNKFTRMIDNKNPISLEEEKSVSTNDRCCFGSRNSYAIFSCFSRMKTYESIFSWCTNHAENIFEKYCFFRIGFLLRNYVNSFRCQTENSNMLFVSSTIDFHHFCCILSIGKINNPFVFIIRMHSKATYNELFFGKETSGLCNFKCRH